MVLRWFDVDVLAFYGLLTVLATFSKIWANFFLSSGRPDDQVPDQFKNCLLVYIYELFLTGKLFS
jgi:hypothetical protein